MSTYTLPAGYTAQTAYSEGWHTGGFMVSFANGHRSIDRIVLAGGQAAILPVGSLLGRITASGHYTLLNEAGSDGSQTCAGILFDAVDATGADTHCAAVVRDAEVNANELSYGALTGPQIAQATADLAVHGVILRA